MQVVWPAFIGACLLELIVFAVVDPAEVHWLGRSTPWSEGGSRQAVYAGAFFVFIGVGLGALCLEDEGDEAAVDAAAFKGVAVFVGGLFFGVGSPGVVFLVDDFLVDDFLGQAPPFNVYP